MRLCKRQAGHVAEETPWWHGNHQRGYIAKPVPRVDNMLADGPSRWPEDKVHDVARLANQDGWRENNIQAHGRIRFSPLVQNKLHA